MHSRHFGSLGARILRCPHTILAAESAHSDISPLRKSTGLHQFANMQNTVERETTGSYMTEPSPTGQRCKDLGDKPQASTEITTQASSPQGNSQTNILLTRRTLHHFILCFGSGAEKQNTTMLPRTAAAGLNIKDIRYSTSASSRVTPELRCLARSSRATPMISLLGTQEHQDGYTRLLFSLMLR